MAPYKIIFKKSAGKVLSGLPKSFAEKIVLKINSLKEDPRPQGVKKLSATTIITELE